MAQQHGLSRLPAALLRAVLERREASRALTQMVRLRRCIALRHLGALTPSHFEPLANTPRTARALPANLASSLDPRIATAREGRSSAEFA